jgi:HD-GYP domain-containing protein (c-di-GMP phosphodiesterase class II)
MTRDRPHRPASTHREAVLELRRCAGVQFDPECVDALVAHLEERGEGSIATTG